MRVTFQLPALSGNQRAILQVALSLVGFPYIWGGTSELPQDPFATGKLVPGGFDCSGFVWRVYKLQAYSGGGNPGATLKGRTTYAMSGEVPRAKRIGIAKLQPADLLFFGSGGPKSKPADINHMGIYLGGGWFVQASSQGVSLVAALLALVRQALCVGPAPARRGRTHLVRTTTAGPPGVNVGRCRSSVSRASSSSSSSSQSSSARRSQGSSSGTGYGGTQPP